MWTQQGNKLVGTGAVGQAVQGSVSLSADGNTAIMGGSGDNSNAGAAWVFTRSGSVWTQRGTKLVGTGAALLGAVRGEDAFYAMLKLTDGDFALDPQFKPQQRVINQSSEALLLEGMRRMDENIG